MKILVCGDRNYTNHRRVSTVLDELAVEHSIYYHPEDNWLPTDITIIHGDATGADRMGGNWAVKNYARLEVFPANWEKYRRAAGPIRNQKMLDEGQPDLVVSFHPDLSKSKGTADMVKRAKKAGIPVIEIK
jgi:hypothetical protein